MERGEERHREVGSCGGGATGDKLQALKGTDHHDIDTWRAQTEALGPEEHNTAS